MTVQDMLNILRDLDPKDEVILYDEWRGNEFDTKDLYRDRHNQKIKILFTTELMQDE